MRRIPKSNIFQIEYAAGPNKAEYKTLAAMDRAAKWSELSGFVTFLPPYGDLQKALQKRIIDFGERLLKSIPDASGEDLQVIEGEWSSEKHDRVP